MGGMNKEELEGSPIFFRTDSCFLVLNFKLGNGIAKRLLLPLLISQPHGNF
jgi:hypothetical protein